MSTVDEVDAFMKQQTRRHEALKRLIVIVAELRKDDDDGADWVLEQLADG